MVYMQRDPPITPQASAFQDPEVVNAVAGAISGALTATFVCPLDVLKTRLQVQRIGTGQRVGIIGGLAGIVRQEGPRGLYRGLSPTLMALLPNWAVFFTVYGRLKTTLTTRQGRTIPATPEIHVAAAAGAGVATLLVTNPLWVVKTRLQTQHMPLQLRRADSRPYKGTFDALGRICREEGFRGLYSGIAPSLMGICHVAIQFPLYEAAKVRAASYCGVRADELNPKELVATSAFSKMVASTITYPHEVIRSYMHVTGSGPISGFKEACQVIWREDGLRGFYRGCLTNLLRTTPAAAVTFTSFELIARAIKQLAPPPPDHQQQQHWQQQQQQPQQIQQEQQQQQPWRRSPLLPAQQSLVADALSSARHGGAAAAASGKAG